MFKNIPQGLAGGKFQTIGHEHHAEEKKADAADQFFPNLPHDAGQGSPHPDIDFYGHAGEQSSHPGRLQFDGVE